MVSQKTNVGVGGGGCTLVHIVSVFKQLSAPDVFIGLLMSCSKMY